jgi:hypothetical protein
MAKLVADIAESIDRHAERGVVRHPHEYTRDQEVIKRVSELLYGKTIGGF